MVVKGQNKPPLHVIRQEMIEAVLCLNLLLIGGTLGQRIFLFFERIKIARVKISRDAADKVKDIADIDKSVRRERV